VQTGPVSADWPTDIVLPGTIEPSGESGHRGGRGDRSLPNRHNHADCPASRLDRPRPSKAQTSKMLCTNVTVGKSAWNVSMSVNDGLNVSFLQTAVAVTISLLTVA
jgi:hypothetical protein